MKLFTSVWMSGLLACSMVGCGEKATQSDPVEPAQRPNILLIQVDDLGYDDLGVHGNPVIETPALDQLAQESVRFEQFYVSSVCAPSRASLLTGRHFWRTGVSGVHAGRDFIHLDETLLPELLQESGYATGMWGKWHSGKTQGYLPWQRGFDEAYYATLYNYFDNNGLLNGKEVKTQGFATNAITDMAISFLARHKDQPFFAYVPYMAPHNPWRAPEEHIQYYKEKGHSQAAASLFGMIDNLDDNIGRLLSALDDFGLAKETVVVFLSDNGPWVKSYRFGLNEKEWELRNPNQRRGKKSKNWENGVHSPLFIRWPEHYSAQQVSDLASAEDLFPTILEWAGVDVPNNLQLDGQSLLPALKGEALTEKSVISAWATPLSTLPSHALDKSGFYRPLTKSYRETFDFEQQRLAIRKGNYKLLKNEKGQGKDELFDLARDPKERHNLVSSSPEVAEALSLELSRWFDEVTANPHAMLMPEFQVGLNQQPLSHVLAYAPSDLSPELMNKDHFLANWQQAGLWADYQLQVHTPGEYDIYLMSKMTSHEGKVFAVQVGAHKASADLAKAKQGAVGTLLRNESAYWEDFDRYETWKKTIRNSYLGSIHLDPGKQTLKVSLEALGQGAQTEQLDQIIAIQLIRRDQKTMETAL